MLKNCLVSSYYYFFKHEAFITPPDSRVILYVSTNITLDNLSQALFAGFMRQPKDNLYFINWLSSVAME